MEALLWGYFMISIFVTWVFLTGRSEWLDQKSAVRIGIKLFLSVFLGVFLGLIIIILYTAKLIFRK